MPGLVVVMLILQGLGGASMAAGGVGAVLNRGSHPPAAAGWAVSAR